MGKDLGNYSKIKINNTSDDSIIVACNQNISKYDNDGNLQWNKQINYNNINTLFESQDNGIILSNDYSVFKLDENGEILLVKEFDSNSVVNSVIEKATGEIVVGGYTGSSIDIRNGYGNFEAIIMELQYEEFLTPIITFDKEIILNGGYDIYIEDTIATSDGGMLLYGESDEQIDFGNGIVLNKGLVILKYNSNGEIKWGRSLIDSENNAMIYSVKELDDEGLLVEGYFSKKLFLDEYVEPYLDYDYDKAEWISVDESILSIEDTTIGNKMLIKFDSNGRLESAEIVDENFRLMTSDGGEVLVKSLNNNVQLRDGKLITIENNSSNNNSQNCILKYDASGNVEWLDRLGLTKIDSVVEMPDKGIVVGGTFELDLTLKNGEIYKSHRESEEDLNYPDGIIIKYSSNGEIEWTKKLEGKINSIDEISDGSIIVTGGVYGYNVNLEDNYTLSNKYSNNGIIIKYDKNGELIWAKALGGDGNEEIKSVCELIDGRIIVNLFSSSSSLNLGNGKIIRNSQGYMLLEVIENTQVDESKELIVENKRKEYRITTASRLVNGEKLGTISGENELAYEKVKYGDSSTKPIVIAPMEDCELVGITVNGKEHSFTVNEDGTYMMPTFENVLENIHVVAQFTSEANTITIKNPDSITGDLLKDDLSGTEFEIEQITEEFSDVIGEWQNIGDSYENRKKFFSR